MKKQRLSLRLLSEVCRIERIAHQYPEPVDTDEVWEALKTIPVVNENAMQLIKWLLLPKSYRPTKKTFGEVTHFQRGCFFSTDAVPFTGIALHGGGEVAAFRATVRKDLAPIVLRFAVDRLWASLDWRFPKDLTQSVAFESVLELAFAGDSSCRYHTPRNEISDSEAGEIELEVVDLPSSRTDQVRLCWRRHWLGFCSDRYGWF